MKEAVWRPDSTKKDGSFVKEAVWRPDSPREDSSFVKKLYGDLTVLRPVHLSKKLHGDLAALRRMVHL